jgi:hypothetical protein
MNRPPRSVADQQNRLQRRIMNWICCALQYCSLQHRGASDRRLHERLFTPESAIPGSELVLTSVKTPLEQLEDESHGFIKVLAPAEMMSAPLKYGSRVSKFRLRAPNCCSCAVKLCSRPLKSHFQTSKSLSKPAIRRVDLVISKKLGAVVAKDQCFACLNHVLS